LKPRADETLLGLNSEPEQRKRRRTASVKVKAERLL
jgi:hypothetical protein